jgi:hypothetical protein
MFHGFNEGLASAIHIVADNAALSGSANRKSILTHIDIPQVGGATAVQSNISLENRASRCR